jgi:putative DNA primase/helicase
MRYVATWGRWIVWNGSVWRMDSKESVRATGKAKDVSVELLRQLQQFPTAPNGATEDEVKTVEEARKKLVSWATGSANRSRINALVDLARSEPGVIVDHNDLDADPWLLCVRNGYIDLWEGSFHHPDPKKLLTMQAPVTYDPQAVAPLWAKSLREWLPDDAVRGYFHALCGEAVVGAVRDHLLVIHYGTGANGKGTAIGALRRVLGPYFQTPHKSLLVQQRHAEHATVYADLFRVRLAVAVETEGGQKLSEASVKNLTGGDEVKARRMHEDFWSFEPTHSLWLQTNYLPEIAGRDEALCVNLV